MALLMEAPMTRDVGLPSSHPGVSRCPVDADGVPAEWVEAGIATLGQSTFVLFERSGYPETLPDHQALAEWLAVTTGARVLSVGSSAASGMDAVHEGVRAYVWLLGEGLDLRRSAFVGDAAGDDLAAAVLQAAEERGLPLPAGGARPFPRAVQLEGRVPYPPLRDA